MTTLNPRNPRPWGVSIENLDYTRQSRRAFSNQKNIAHKKSKPVKTSLCHHIDGFYIQKNSPKESHLGTRAQSKKKLITIENKLVELLNNDKDPQAIMRHLKQQKTKKIEHLRKCLHALANQANNTHKIRNDSLTIFDLILKTEPNININTKDTDGNTPLMKAVTINPEANHELCQQKIKLARALLELEGIDVKKTNKKNESAIIIFLQNPKLYSIPLCQDLVNGIKDDENLIDEAIEKFDSLYKEDDPRRHQFEYKVIREIISDAKKSVSAVNCGVTGQLIKTPRSKCY